MTRAIWGLGVNKHAGEKEEEQRVESTRLPFLVGKQRMTPLAGRSRRIVILAANSDRSNGGWVRLDQIRETNVLTSERRLNSESYSSQCKTTSIVVGFHHSSPDP